MTLLDFLCQAGIHTARLLVVVGFAMTLAVIGETYVPRRVR